VNNLLRRLFPGWSSRHFWTEREAGNQAYIDGYWNTRTAPARAAIAAAIAPLEASSLLEVGAHCGPNLWAIRQARKDLRLEGTELSDFVRREGQKLLGDTAALRYGDLRRLPYPSRSFDIVLSSNTLVCVGPRDIRRAMNELLRVATKWLVIAEPLDDSPASFSGTEDRYPNTCYWIRNYAALFQSITPCSVESLTRIRETIGHLNSVMVLRLHR
jgi:ubiquinone/menaquinone biosynthesis C-methylase UbiE